MGPAGSAGGAASTASASRRHRATAAPAQPTARALRRSSGTRSAPKKRAGQTPSIAAPQSCGERVIGQPAAPLGPAAAAPLAASGVLAWEASGVPAGEGDDTVAVPVGPGELLRESATGVSDGG